MPSTSNVPPITGSRFVLLSRRVSSGTGTRRRYAAVATTTADTDTPRARGARTHTRSTTEAKPIRRRRRYSMRSAIETRSLNPGLTLAGARAVTSGEPQDVRDDRGQCQLGVPPVQAVLQQEEGHHDERQGERERDLLGRFGRRPPDPSDEARSVCGPLRSRPGWKRGRGGRSGDRLPVHRPDPRGESRGRPAPGVRP